MPSARTQIDRKPRHKSGKSFKNFTARANRREAKRDPEAAGVRHRYNGYSS